MRAVVLGAGLQGSAAAFDLARSEGIRSLLLADADPRRLDEARRMLGEGVDFREADLTRPEQLSSLLAEAQLCLSALPYFLNAPVAQACAHSGIHYVDLGGSPEQRRKILELDAEARASGAVLLPDCGLAPGLAATVGMAALEGFEPARSLRIRVGGLPQEPHGPLNYVLVFSIHGLINEYCGEDEILRDGRLCRAPALSALEELDFGAPLGRLEAFITRGGGGNLPRSLAGRVQDFDYKTLRYPGHAEQIRLLAELGFFDEEPLELGELRVSPRAVTAQLLAERLADPASRDLVVFRAEAEGESRGRRLRRRYELIDQHDPESGLSAMQRCTAFPASVMLQLIARGEGPGPGAWALERAMAPGLCLSELELRGLRFQVREEEID